MNKIYLTIPLFLLIYFILSYFQNPDCSPHYLKPFEEFKNSPPKQITLILEEVYQSTLDRGISNYIPFSSMLVIEAHKSLKRKDYERAFILSDYAEKLSPDFYLSCRYAGVSKWRAKRFSFIELIETYFKSFEMKAYDLEYLRTGSARFFSTLVLSFSSVLLVLCIIFMIRYGSLLFHDLRHHISCSVSNPPLKILFIIILTLPLLLNISIFWNCLFIMLLLLAYQTRREKITTFIVLFLCIFLPFLIWYLSFFIHAGQNQVIKAIWNVNYGYWTEEDIETLQSDLKNNPSDPEVLFSLALVQKKQGRYTSARSLYSQIVKNHKSDFRVLTNMGNVYYAEGKWEESVEMYKEAVKADSVRSGAALFNLSRAYMKMFMFDEAEDKFLEAKSLDRTRVDHYIRIYSENINRLLIDEVVSRSSIFKRAYKMFVDEKEYANGIWDFLFAGISFITGTLVLACSILAGFLLLLKDNLRIAVKCYMCGKSICKRCEVANSADLLCAQCSTILKGARKVEPVLKKQKIEEILRYQNFNFSLSKFLCFVLPGTGYIWKGKTLTGTFLLLLFFMLTMNLLTGFYFNYHVRIETDSWSWINMVLILAMWVFTAITSLKYKTAGHQEMLLKKIVAMSKEQ